MIPDSPRLSTSTATSLSGSDDASTTTTSPRCRRRRLRDISRRAKSTAKHVLHIDATEEQVHARTDGVFDDIEGNPAFNPQNVFREKPATLSEALASTKGGIQKAGYAILHPKQSVKRKAATTLATPEQPFLSEKADQVLLDAHERLENARASMSSEEEDAGQWEEEVDNIEAQRESLRVAWTTSRFVHRVRVVPAHRIEYPSVPDFWVYDNQGNYIGTDWIKWWGKYMLYATQHSPTRCIESVDRSPFNRDILVEHVERILMASAPLQSYVLNLRKVWRWEDPKKTGRWFAIFMLLWSIDHVITFCLCYVVFIVVLNRFRCRSVEMLRESHERALDQGATAFKISELIHRHGAGQWLDPLIDEIGPRAQIQMNDLADFLEMLQNFYDWKSPEKTLATLFTFFSAIALGILTPTGYSMRVVTFVLIWWFFTGRVVASHYPKYRRVVSPIAFVFWDLPTHAQWSFRYLHTKAQAIRERVVKRAMENGSVPETTTSLDRTPCSAESSSTSNDDSQYSTSPDSHQLDSLYFLTFRCRYHGLPGRLALFSTGICFIRLLPAKELWRRPFSELTEMRKIRGSAVGRGHAKKQLEFTFTDGTVVRVDAVAKRDEAFNSILGFSGLNWQMLEPLERRNQTEVEGQ